MTSEVVVYGASGHTGRFVTEELLRRGIRPVLAGRNPDRLEQVSALHGGLDRRAFDLDSASEVRAAIAGSAVVVNCAGPFLDTAVPLATAAVGVGAHYLDVAAEQAAVGEVYRSLDAPATAAGVAVVPAMAFYGGLPDLLVTAALDGSDAPVDVSVAVWVDRWWPTEGTRETGRRNPGPRSVVRDGGLVELAEPAAADWEFPEPVGTAAVVEVPLSEALTISRHLPVRTLGSYIAARALADIRDPDTPAPSAADDSGRSSQQFVVDVRVDDTRRVVASGRDIYAISAPIVVAGVQELLAGRITRPGASAPGQVFDARRILASLHGDGMTILPTPS